MTSTSSSAGRLDVIEPAPFTLVEIPPTGEIPTGLRVAVTGHRPQDLDGAQTEFAKAELVRLVAKLAPSVGITGMALGADTWWADALLAAGVPYHAYVPFPDQPSRWPASAQAHYRMLLEKAAKVVMVCEHYHRGAFQLRNQAMVDNADLLVAVWTGKRAGGTFNCLRYGWKLVRPVVHVDPVRRVTVRQKPPTPKTPASPPASELTLEL